MIIIWGLYGSGEGGLLKAMGGSSVGRKDIESNTIEGAYHGCA